MEEVEQSILTVCCELSERKPWDWVFNIEQNCVHAWYTICKTSCGYPSYVIVLILKTLFSYTLNKIFLNLNLNWIGYNKNMCRYFFLQQKPDYLIMIYIVLFHEFKFELNWLQQKHDYLILIHTSIPRSWHFVNEWLPAFFLSGRTSCWWCRRRFT